MRNNLVYSARFLICLYTSILPPLLPLFMEKMHLSLMLTATLVSVFCLSTSLLQPLFGWIEDRIGYRIFLLWSPVWVGIFIGAIGIFPHYRLIVLLLALSGIGVCAFHPASFAYAGRVPSNNNSITISFLLLAGSLGFVVGPIAVSLFVDFLGMERLYLIALPGAILSFALWKTCSCDNDKPKVQSGNVFRQLSNTLISIMPLFLFVLCITIISMNLYTFAPILLKQKGSSVVIIGFLLSMFTFGCACGPMLGSVLAKRIGNFNIIMLSMSLSVVFLLCFVHIQESVIKSIIFLLLGLSLMAPFSIIIDIGQKIVPQYLGVVSSLLGGFTWGIGGLLIILTGWIAGFVGIANVLDGLIILPLANLLLANSAGSFRSR